MCMISRNNIYAYISGKGMSGLRISDYQKQLFRGLRNGYTFMRFGSTRGSGPVVEFMEEKSKNEIECNAFLWKLRAKRRKMKESGICICICHFFFVILRAKL